MFDAERAHRHGFSGRNDEILRDLPVLFSTLYQRARQYEDRGVALVFDNQLVDAAAYAALTLRPSPLLSTRSAFLLLAMVTMIWHASAMYQMTWLWYVAGICLGSAIIVLFAVFEKKRAKMLELIDELRRWRH